MPVLVCDFIYLGYVSQIFWHICFHPIGVFEEGKVKFIFLIDPNKQSFKSWVAMSHHFFLKLKVPSSFPLVFPSSVLSIYFHQQVSTPKVVLTPQSTTSFCGLRSWMTLELKSEPFCVSQLRGVSSFSAIVQPHEHKVPFVIVYWMLFHWSCDCSHKNVSPLPQPPPTLQLSFFLWLFNFCPFILFLYPGSGVRSQISLPRINYL